MDALCKRFNIDNSKREKHTALVDCQLLKEVYINLVDQKEPKLNLQNTEISDQNIGQNSILKISSLGKIIKPTKDELEKHKNYLKSNLQKNYFD